MGFFGYPRI
jgi:hypothetical protein